MTTNEIRKKFLEFFASKGHTIVESDSVVPKDDPTVLFTTAGMQQFKRQFLGYIDGYTRASSSQKCLRTDDLDKVGRTDFHHTFFEMLGNFSFGDYFKKEAIAWAWEFLTQWMKIPTEKLWVSVYKDDEETAQIWLREIKIHPDKLVRLGDHSNFWPADAKEKGPNGPCGPCSEIFYDYGVNTKCQSRKCDPACDCGRFSEIWNLVFTQFNRQEGGVLEPLPNKNIDTGMGLERLAAVVQRKKNNYETDLFQPIIQAIEEKIEQKNIQIEKTEKFIITDHMRAIVFAISDGVVPSNEARGYVVKKLIIEASDLVLSREMTQPIIYKLVPAVIEAMKHAYPEIAKEEERIALIIRRVEEAFIAVRKTRIPELEKLIHDTQCDSERLAQIFFDYHDRYGLTDSTLWRALQSQAGSREEWEQVKKHVKEHYDFLMGQQRQRSRANSKMTGDVFTDTEAVFDVPRTEFLGYDHSQSKGVLLRLFINNQKVNEASKGDTVKVVLDKTPFYAEAGGQAGDTGYIRGQNGKIRVEDTRKVNEIYVHSGIVEDGLIRAGESVEANIDRVRRLSIMRHHTATHLLQAALREVLGAHIQQQGSFVSEDRLRFDFTHPKALSREELVKIEQRVNEYILQCDRVTKESLSIQDARGSGALAFFAEKYGDVVRVVSAGDYSKEFCGGTHLDFTGQIGLFKIVDECAIAQGIRRLEAKAGTQALQWIRDREDQMEEAARILKTSPQELVSRVDAQAKRLRETEKDLEKYRFEILKSEIDIMIANAETLNGVKVICHVFSHADMATLRRVSDLIKQKSKSSVVVLGAETSDASSLLIAVTDDLVGKGIKADEMIKEVAPVIGGSGGGRPQLAQAGGRETGKMGQAIEKAHQIIERKIQ